MGEGGGAEGAVAEGSAGGAGRGGRGFVGSACFVLRPCVSPRRSDGIVVPALRVLKCAGPCGLVALWLKCIHLTTPALPRPSQKENIMELIKAVAEDPETLATLVRLLQQLLVDPGTQKSLLELLAWVFKDPYTQENLLGLLYVTLRGTVE